jgi:hypothetical protein
VQEVGNPWRKTEELCVAKTSLERSLIDSHIDSRPCSLVRERTVCKLSVVSQEKHIFVGGWRVG